MTSLIQSKKILTIFAHPDDEVLGAGGTLYKASRLNSDIHVLIPATGIHGRKFTQNKKYRDKALEKLRADSKRALGGLGINARQIYFGSFCDNEMDKFSLLTIINFMERYIERLEPDLIFTHHFNCTNIDHRLCYEAAVIALRPDKLRHINLVSCEIPSSTGYLRPTMWEPNLYIQLSEEAVEAKIKAMLAYEEEAREDPHPRSQGVLRALAKLRGSEAGFSYAEAFMTVKIFG